MCLGLWVEEYILYAARNEKLGIKKFDSKILFNFHFILAIGTWFFILARGFLDADHRTRTLLYRRSI